MRTKKDCTRRTGSTPASDLPTGPSPRRAPAPNAFKDSFLLEARRLGDPDTTAQALLAAPGQVEPVERPNRTLWAVTRRGDGLAEGGGACAVCLDRATALRLASVLPALATPNPFHVGRHEKRRGYTLHRTAGSWPTSPGMTPSSPPTSTWPTPTPRTSTPWPCSSSPSATRPWCSWDGWWRGGSSDARPPPEERPHPGPGRSHPGRGPSLVGEGWPAERCQSLSSFSGSPR